MTASELETVERAWPAVAPILFVPRTEREYERLVSILDTLIDVVGEDEGHPLASQRSGNAKMVPAEELAESLGLEWKGSRYRKENLSASNQPPPHSS